MTDYKRMIETWANDPYISHKDYTKCKLCLREYLRSEVSKEFLNKGKTEQEHILEICREVDHRWKETELFKLLKSLNEKGLSIEAIADEMKKSGYIP